MEEKNIKEINIDTNSNQQSILKKNTDETSIIKYNIRDAINFKNKFAELKTKEDADLNDMEELLEHDNTNGEYIEYYLDALSKKYKEIFKDKLIIYYPIISPKVCEKFNINKKISEKDRFYDLYKKIIAAKNNEEICDIVSKEFEFPIELKTLKFNKLEEKKYKNVTRWKIFGNKMLNFQKIDNEEYFYYVITNTLLNNFKDPFINEELYHKSLKNLFRVLQSLKEKMFIFDDKKYSLLFEYTILLILNSEYNSILSQINNTFLYEIFTNSLYNEINSVKSLNDEEIIKEFSKYNKKVEIKNNSIISCDNSFKTIENYQNYYITHKFIRTFSEENFIGNMLMHYIKFDLLINPKYYFSGYLYNIIEAYVSSNLSKSSIYECFNINQDQCPELENEIFTNCSNFLYKLVFFSTLFSLTNIFCLD